MRLISTAADCERLAAHFFLELLARGFLGEAGDLLELLARLDLRGLGLLDGGVGLLDLAVDALLFLLELAGAALGILALLVDVALFLRRATPRAWRARSCGS